MSLMSPFLVFSPSCSFYRLMNQSQGQLDCYRNLTHFRRPGKLLLPPGNSASRLARHLTTLRYPSALWRPGVTEMDHSDTYMHDRVSRYGYLAILSPSYLGSLSTRHAVFGLALPGGYTPIPMFGVTSRN